MFYLHSYSATYTNHLCVPLQPIIFCRFLNTSVSAVTFCSPRGCGVSWIVGASCAEKRRFHLGRHSLSMVNNNEVWLDEFEKSSIIVEQGSSQRPPHGDEDFFRSVERSGTYIDLKKRTSRLLIEMHLYFWSKPCYAKNHHPAILYSRG